MGGTTKRGMGRAAGTCLAAAFLFCTANASADWTYDAAAGTITDGVWTLDVTCSGTELTITGGSNAMMIAPLDLRGTISNPKGTDGYTLVAIADGADHMGAFSSEASISALYFPDTLARIGDYAFFWCRNINGNLVIPDSVTHIGKGAFGQCSGFTGTLSLSSNLAHIGAEAFSRCTGFSGSLLLPASVVEIGEAAFAFCTGFDGALVLPRFLTNLNAGVFYGCSGFSSELLIPSTVTNIGERAFAECSGLTGFLFISYGMISIGDEAFYNCSGFDSHLWLPGTLATIGAGAFKATGFTDTLTIPASVTNIGAYAFAECAFDSVVCPSDGVTFGLGAFTSCPLLTSMTFTGAYPASVADGFYNTGETSSPNATSYVARTHAPSWVPHITPGADGNIWQGQPIVIASFLTFDPNGGEGGDPNIYIVENGGPMPSIVPFPPWLEGHTFQGYFDAPTGGTKYYDADTTAVKATWDKDGDTILYAQWMPRADWIYDAATSTMYNHLWTLGVTCSGTELTVTGCQNMPLKMTPLDLRGTILNPAGTTRYTLVAIADGVDNGNGTLFLANDSMSGVHFPDTLGYIGDYAFARCGNLSGDLVIPDSVVHIGAEAFTTCDNLDGTLSLSTSLTNIGTHAFARCVNLTGDLVIPDSVTSLSDFAFFSCSGFDGNLVLSTNLTTIESRTFHNCNSLSGDLVIPGSVTNIADFAFVRCFSFTGVVFPAGLLNIGQQAFENCIGLTRIMIPAHVASIGAGAFLDCENLQSVICPSDGVKLGQMGFAGCPSLTSVAFTGGYPDEVSGDLYNFYYDSGEFIHENISPNVTSYVTRAHAETWKPHVTGSFEDGTGIWQEQPIIIASFLIFDPNGGTGGENGIYFIENGDPMPAITAASPVLQHHAFQGYFDAPTGGAKYYNKDMVPAVPAWDKTGDTTLYAQWIIAADWIYDADTSTMYNDLWTLGVTCSGTELTITDTVLVPALLSPLDLRGNILNPAGTTSYTLVAIADGTDTTGALVAAKPSLGQLHFPDTLVSIGDHAFFWCDNITGDLVIPDSVIHVGQGAFLQCTGFDGTLSLSSNLTNIGAQAFARCTNLTGDLRLPDSLLSIGDEAFNSCRSLDGFLTLPRFLDTINTGVFYGCSRLTGHLLLPGGTLTNISAHAFGECHGFTGFLMVSHPVATIGEGAFFNCHGFDGNLALPDSLTHIGARAFARCSGFTHGLTLPHSLVEIGDYAFTQCSGFNGELILPRFLTNINTGVFLGCSGLTGGLLLPGGTLTNISNYAFTDCYGLTGFLMIPHPVVSIGYAAFFNCHGFDVNLSLPDSLTHIGDAAFFKCSGFTYGINIPDSVTYIGSLAFASNSVPSVTSPSTGTTFGQGVFTDNPNLTSVTFSGTYPAAIAGDLYNVYDHDGILRASSPNVTSYVARAYADDWNFELDEGNLYYHTGIWQEQPIRINTSAVTFDANGGTGDLPSGFFLDAGDPLPVVTAAPVLDGHDFTGYFDAPEGGVQYYTDDLSPAVPAWDKIGDTILYAQWSLLDGWIYDAVTSTMYNDIWTLGVTCSGSEITITSVVAIASLSTPVDLRGNIRNPAGTASYTLVAIADGDAQSGAFYEARDVLAGVRFPGTLTHIGDHAFSRCANLAGNLLIPDSVVRIGAGAFTRCHGFTGGLVLPGSLTHIGDGAFAQCRGFTGDLVLPDSVTFIGDNAFNGCNGFDGTLVLPANLANIPVGAFFLCANLSGPLLIPGTVTNIADVAFSQCPGFDALTLPDGLLSIGMRALENCFGLAGNLHIPDTIATIGKGAFWGCTSLASVVCPSDGVVFGEFVFAGNPALTSVTFTGGYPATVGGNLYNVYEEVGNDVFEMTSPNVTSYVMRAHAESWASHVESGDLFDGTGIWHGQPIRVVTVVTFDPNGGTGGETGTLLLQSGDPMPAITPEPPVLPNHTFQGYFDAPSGGTKYYGSDMLPALPAWDKTGDTILYAQWLPDQGEEDERNVLITRIQVTDTAVILNWDPVTFDDGKTVLRHIIHAKANLGDDGWARLESLPNADLPAATSTQVPHELADQNGHTYRFFYKTVIVQ